MRLAMANSDERNKSPIERLENSSTINLLMFSIALIATITVIKEWYRLAKDNFGGLGWEIAALLAIWLILLIVIKRIEHIELEKTAKKRSEMANYLLLTFSEGKESFYDSWQKLLAEQARKGGYNNVFITPELALVDHNNKRIQKALEHLEDLKAGGHQHFDGAFAILKNPDDSETRKQLLRYYKLFDSNLILLDMNIDRQQNTTRGYPNIDFIGSDEHRGGELAAQLAFDYLTKFDAPILKPRILILEAYKGQKRWDQQRIESFKNMLNNSFNNVANLEHCIFESINECSYQRETTSEKLECHQRQIPTSEFLLNYDLIFASNDDTALGALDVITKALENDENLIGKKGIRKHKGPRIIGYDGSKDFLKLLHKDNQWLLGTVNVFQKKQASDALKFMDDLRKLNSSSGIVKKIIGTIKKIIKNWSINKSKKNLNFDESHDESSNFHSSKNNSNSDTSNHRHLDSPKLQIPEIKIAPYLTDPFITKLNNEKIEGFTYSVVSPDDIENAS